MQYARHFLRLYPIKLTVLFALLLLLGSLVAGCGGGGGGGGGGGQGSNGGGDIQIEGTVVESGTSSAPLVGWTVEFDGRYSATTQAPDGSFTLNVPASAITGNDTLSVLSSGALEAVFTFNFNAITGNPKVLPNPLTVGPPAPPPLDKRAGS